MTKLDFCLTCHLSVWVLHPFIGSAMQLPLPPSLNPSSASLLCSFTYYSISASQRNDAVVLVNLILSLKYTVICQYLVTDCCFLLTLVGLHSAAVWQLRVSLCDVLLWGNVPMRTKGACCSCQVCFLWSFEVVQELRSAGTCASWRTMAIFRP